jgi:hypothetical protein
VGKGEQVSRRLIRLDIPVFPDRRMFRVHDATVDPDAPGGPLAPLGALISVNREQIWVGSLQEHIGVRLFLEEWDIAPPPYGDEWEDEAKAVIYFRGGLSVDMGSAGRWTGSSWPAGSATTWSACSPATGARSTGSTTSCSSGVSTR